MRKKLVCLVLTIAAVLSVSAMVGCSKDTPSIVQPPQSEYTVTYELNGGTGITPIETPKKSGETFYLAVSTGFEKDGYVFDKWNDGKEDYAAGAQYTMPSSNVTFTAKWKMYEEDLDIQKTVRYENIDGTGMNPVGAFKVGEGLSELPTPEKAGNTFGGWYESSDFGGESVTSISASRDTDVILYAKWTANTYAVSYDNKAGASVQLTQGNTTATYGENYTFIVKETGKIPVTVTIIVGENTIAATKKDGVYTLNGSDVIGDIKIELSVRHVEVNHTAINNVHFDMEDIAEKGSTFDFNITAERGYKITAVTVSDDDGARTVTKNASGYSVEIGEKAVTVSAIVEEISYSVQYVYDTPTTDQFIVDEGTVTYKQYINLPSSETIVSYIPANYEFKGWKIGDIELGNNVSMLTDVDGATVEIYAVLQGEKHTVSLGDLKGFDVKDSVTGNSVTVYYGDDLYLNTLFDNVDGYATEWSVSNGIEVEKDAQGKPYIEGTALTEDITINGENFVAPSEFYNKKTSYDIPDVFENNNEYHVIAALGEDGLYFRAIVKQHSLNREIDGIYFSIGNHEGTTYYNKDKSFHHYGVNAKGDNHNCDRYVVKVEQKAAYYDIVYEGFVAYETFIYETSFGYSPSAFTGSALDTAEVYAGMRIINKANMTSVADTVLTSGSQERLEKLSWDPDASASIDTYGYLVNPDGRFDMDYRNRWKIMHSGITSTEDNKGVDGVISDNEYAGSVVYVDTKTDRHNKMEIFAEHKDGGIKIGMRITALIVAYGHNNIVNNLDKIDLLQVAYYRKGDSEISRTWLLANGRVHMNFEPMKGFITAVGIDKSHAGAYGQYGNNDGTGLKAEGEDYKYWFVTTYEMFIPDSYLFKCGEGEVVSESDAQSDVQVMIQHRHQAPNLTGWWYDAAESGTNKNTGDALSFENCAKWTSVWQYSPGVEDPGMWATNLNYTLSTTGITQITSDN